MEAEKIFFNYDIVTNAFNKLINLIKDDEQHIKNNNIDKINDSLNERTDLMNFLARQKETLARLADKRSILNEDQAKVLNELSQELHFYANKSKREISKAMYVNQKILTIVRGIVDKEARSVNYNQRGVRKNTSKFREIPHLAINKKL
ncbi:hypothetical protein I862_03630 [endosymbiont of Acanthamoeba sp. UWC8]|uniref:hypothetical protein n=1 Tax=endosymbiont of Acanthamoeba sp. UWC8 TaxID=86106 RepID=UPI0004D1A69D|nr:hypothetical protein [endosymbiont of Acanthamoeba sp. UWC8]AIF81286.1 hypothetical protein I862_03630 [endosymbiont of Acanthamoeba sp. UWC8]